MGSRWPDNQLASGGGTPLWACLVPEPSSPCYSNSEAPQRWGQTDMPCSPGWQSASFQRLRHHPGCGHRQHGLLHLDTNQQDFTSGPRPAKQTVTDTASPGQSYKRLLSVRCGALCVQSSCKRTEPTRRLLQKGNLSWCYMDWEGNTPVFLSSHGCKQHRPTSAKCISSGVQKEWADCHLLGSCLMKHKLVLEIVLKIEKLDIKIIRV